MSLSRSRGFLGRHHGRLRPGVVASALALVLGMTASVASGGDGSTVRTTSADGGRTVDSGTEPASGEVATVGAEGAGGAGSSGTKGDLLEAAGGASLPNRSLPTAPPPPRLTTTTSPPRAPAGSREIAFANGPLWLVHADGTEATSLTAPEASDATHGITEPDWAPDGSRLVAVQWHGDVTGRMVGRLSIVDLEGNVRPLTEEGAEHFSPVWSPDGTRIAYVAARDRVGWSVPEVDVWIVQADGSNPRKLSGLKGRRVQWSPDGRRVMSGCVGSNALCTVAADGTDLRQVPNSSNIFDFAWASDGGRLAIAASGPDGRYLGVMRVDGTERRSLLGGWGLVGLDWSPDSRTVVFSGVPDSPPPPESCVLVADSVYDSCPDPEAIRIWRIDADGSDHRMLHIGGYYPSWRPQSP